ncbi:protocadherin Fat 1, partial [Nephila pilipes]
NPCLPNPCRNGGICNSDGSSFTCSCISPYTGMKCEKVCTCDNGTCELENGNRVCVCPPEFGLYTPSTCRSNL